MLGITPRADVIPDGPPVVTNGKSSAAHKASVQTAWEEADMAPASGHPAEEDEEEESRYRIDDRREPPRKRRRLGRESDAHTVFTTDDEDAQAEDVEEYSLHVVEDAESVSAVKGAKAKADRSAASEKRDYWLSKGLSGIASDSD